MANKGLLVGIGTALALGAVGLGVYFGLVKKDKKEEEPESGGGDIVPDLPSLPSSNTSSPFRNEQEGNAFRLWMSINYPNYRYNGNKLDVTGSHNNAIIRDAYSKYGAEYEASKSIKLNDAVAENLGKELGTNKSKFYTSLSDGSKVVLVLFGNNNKYRAVFYDNGRVWVSENNPSNKNVYKGNYTLGGKKITITEGLNRGKTYNAPSVLDNLKVSIANYSNFVKPTDVADDVIMNSSASFSRLNTF